MIKERNEASSPAIKQVKKPQGDYTKKDIWLLLIMSRLEIMQLRLDRISVNLEK